jgi:hypothetical protein
LDEPVRALIGRAHSSLRFSESLEKRIEKSLIELESHPWGADRLDEAERVIAMAEKFSRAQTNLAKAISELTRLRSFVAGGPDSRQDYTAKSERELLALIRTKLDEMGYEIVPKALEVSCTTVG